MAKTKIDLRKFDSAIAVSEGKKHQALLCDVREVRKLVIRMLRLYVKNGQAADVAKLVGLTKYLDKSKL